MLRKYMLTPIAYMVNAKFAHMCNHTGEHMQSNFSSSAKTLVTLYLPNKVINQVFNSIFS